MSISQEIINVEQRLLDMNIELPKVPQPIANFIPWKRQGDIIYLSGQTCEWNGEVIYQGKVGSNIDLEQAQDAARICALNLIAALRQALDNDLNRVQSCIRVGGFVHCAPDFQSVPHVINGASDLFHTLFGSKVGGHARTAIGVAQLPQGASVEVDAFFAVA
ncbi:RidA family protein [Sneathiella litorea]|uniref:RidA family protein n=1 Tax=Sneathiella litorea TaxID=2606216 RepID=A0A6L8W6I3_9PROT|nr:RidA family protein [Sneathiella litorea]MZR30711.1 RidA family protein [Sneathiella litorea]